MDVIFQPSKGQPFAMEVGFFDTVLEIKEQIQKSRLIPIPKQTLVFKGHVLQDDRDVESCEILEHSRIQLLVANSNSELDHRPSTVLRNPQSPLPTSNNNKLIHLNVNIPLNQSQFPIEMDPNDSIRRLKERIHEIDAVGPINMIVLQSNSSSAELHDQLSLRDCDLPDNADIEVGLRPSPAVAVPVPVPSSGPSKNKLKVMVKPKCGSPKIPMEVNATDNVGELKKELQKLQQRLHFHLPPEGFFFIYDQDVMDEDRSFRWHGVANGDTIEIFNGSVTGGS